MTIEQQRKKIGKHFAAQRKRLNLSRYYIWKNTSLSITQIKSIDEGSKAYTTDSLLIYASKIGIKKIDLN